MKKKNLTIRRIQKELSQKDLAKQVGVTSQAISDYERGRYNPSYDVMRLLARKLESTVDELFFSKD